METMSVDHTYNAENTIDNVIRCISPALAESYDIEILIIDDASGQTLPWYVFGDPALVPVLEYSYLSGNEGPHVETRSGFAQGADIDGS
jgi:glycosyltransferase involved in cell wall biosynthesis